MPEVSRGAAFGDIDNDGDVDILVSNNNGPARLFRNDSPSTGWVTVVPQASQPLGAKITLYREDLMPLVRRVHTDSSYCSASDARVHFGLGDKSGIGSVEVVWPDGTMETWEAPPARKPLLARKGTGKTPVRTNK